MTKKRKKRIVRVGRKPTKWKHIFILLELSKKERTSKEQKRVVTFLKGKAKHDAIPQRPCKTCGRLIPKPLAFCSSKCWRENSGKDTV